MAFSIRMEYRCLSIVALCAVASAGCGSSMSTRPAAPAIRFPDPGGFVVEVDTAKWPHIDGRIAPLYPMGPRMRRENARVIVAMIIDSSGIVERRSVTLLSPPNPEFDSAVCAYLAAVRLKRERSPARRTLVVFPFDFTVEGGDELPPAPDYHELAMQFDAIPRPELVQRFEAERHCE